MFASIRPSDGDWSAAEQVNDVTDNSQTSPDVGLDDLGNACAVWVDGRNAGTTLEDIYSADRPAGGAWSSSTRVNMDTGMHFSFPPALAMNGNGDVHVVWEDMRNGFSEIFHRMHPVGDAWSASVKVNDDTTGADHIWPHIAVDGLGTAFAAWLDLRNGNGDIYAAFWSESTGWGDNASVIPAPEKSTPDTRDINQSPNEVRKPDSGSEVIGLSQSPVSNPNQHNAYMYQGSGSELDRIVVTPENVTLTIGDTQIFTAKAVDEQGNELPITPTWSTTGERSHPRVYIRLRKKVILSLRLRFRAARCREPQPFMFPHWIESLSHRKM